MKRTVVKLSSAATLSLVLLAYPRNTKAGTPAACSLEGPNNCQLYDGSTGRTISDLDSGWVVADDFVPTGDTITSLCVWGQYINIDPNAAQADCWAESAPDDFEVEIYPNNGQQPWVDQSLGRVVASSVGTPVALDRGTTGQGTLFRFELTLASPFTGLVTGAPYWLSVRNRSGSDASPYCRWHWSQLSPASTSGNRFSVRGPLYSLVKPHAADFTFCMDVDIASDGMGPVERACCTCDGNCATTTLAACNALGGQWYRWDASCGGIVCAGGAPPNDECASATPIEIGNYLYSTVCATTSDPNPVETEFGPTDIQKDLWFTYVHEIAGCVLHIYTCNSEFDSVLAVYFDASNPDACPCPTDENIETLLMATDEGCAGGDPVASGGRVSIDGLCTDVRGCYTIRVGGYSNDAGLLALNVDCAMPRGYPVPPPQVDPLEYRKSRFLTLDFPLPDVWCVPSNFPYAFRVKLTSLHHVEPPYAGSPSIPFSTFEGQHRWLGPPVQYVESVSSGVPFVVSTLQCTPHYQDWSTLTKLHVTGSAVVPSSIYHVETVSPSCQGFETTPTCQSGGSSVSPSVEIRTSRWCDLEIPTSPPSPTLQPDLGDISKLISKFADRDNPPSKARCLMVGDDLFGNFSAQRLAVDFSFSSVAAAVDAFRGRGYPHLISSCP